mgnify:CR=1 FL=1
MDWTNELLANLKAGKTQTYALNTVPDKGQGMGLWEAPRGALAHFNVIEGKRLKNYQCVVPTTWNASPRDNKGVRGPLEEALVGIRYFLTRSGPGTSNIAEAGGFLATPGAPSGRPDLQLHFVPAQLDDHGRNRLPGHGYTFHCCGLRPSSRGRGRRAGGAASSGTCSRGARRTGTSSCG